MATVRRFEELIVWQMAEKQCADFYQLIEDGCFEKHYPLQDQMDRSSASVMDNIAEGFDRHSRADFRHFLVMARGSNAEFRSQLYRARRRNRISQETFEMLKQHAEHLGVKLHHFIGYLLRTSMKEKSASENPYQEVSEVDMEYAPDISLHLPDDFFNLI